MILPVLLLLSSLIVRGNSNPNEIQTHVAYTRPIPLAPGGVSNAFHRLPMPKGPIAVSRFEADIVERDPDTGEMIPVLLSDAYLHHHVVGSGGASKNKWTPMKPQNFSRAVGFGAGTESRGTPQAFVFPYAFVTVEGEEFWIANVHIINTRSLAPELAHRCLECPCTAENRHGMDASWSSLAKNSNTTSRIINPQCNAELQAVENSACFHETYHGGLRCCENGVSCLAQDEVAEHPMTMSTYYLRYRFEYVTLSSVSSPTIKPISVASCCDATGDLEHHGAVEYDLPLCNPELHPGCVYTLSTRQTIDALSGQSVYSVLDGPGAANADSGTGEWIELVFAVGHQHRSGMGIHLYNDTTDELICSSIPTYGNGTGIGNERGYITAMSTCTFDPPLIMRRNTVVKIVSNYDNTLAHTGVMSLFYLAIAEINAPAAALALSKTVGMHDDDTSCASVGHFSDRLWLFLAVGSMVAVVGYVQHQVQHRRRRHYEQVVTQDP